MSESIEMFNARTTISSTDKIKLIFNQDFKFEYGCAVKVGRAEVFSNKPSDDSYSIEISVNEEIQKLQAQLKDANETIEFYSSKTTIFSASLEVDSNNDYCEPSGSIARKYLEKYKAVSNE
jgi:hypothetical protein